MLLLYLGRAASERSQVWFLRDQQHETYSSSTPHPLHMNKHTKKKNLWQLDELKKGALKVTAQRNIYLALK